MKVPGMSEELEDIRQVRESRTYRSEQYALLRRLKCCPVCKGRDSRTEAGGALCARCLEKKRQKAAERRNHGSS